MDHTHLMVMASSLLLGLSIFFSIFLFIAKRNHKYRLIKRLLAFILLAFALRIAKSVIYILFPEYSSTLTSVGIIGMLAIGPLYHFYIRSILIKVTLNYWHFAPMLLVILALPWLLHEGSQNSRHYILFYIYMISLAHMLAYFIWGIGILNNANLSNSKGHSKKERWAKKLTASMIFIWVGFVLQAFVSNKILYVFVTLGEVIAFFIIALIAMRDYGFIIKSANNFAEENSALESLAKKAVKALKKDKLYIKSDLSISMLAEEIGTNRHSLSMALNNFEYQSFPELLNHLRIEHSLMLLKDLNIKDLSVEAIAFESGFNSLSVFYYNFKKLNNLTPAEYRKKYSSRVVK